MSAEPSRISDDWTTAEAVICMRVADLATPVPGARQDVCSKCHQTVWVSPSTQYFRGQRPELTLECTHCADLPETHPLRPAAPLRG
jgi:hypothetical protein